jgi:hypothetical protein
LYVSAAFKQPLVPVSGSFLLRGKNGLHKFPKS